MKTGRIILGIATFAYCYLIFWLSGGEFARSESFGAFIVAATIFSGVIVSYPGKLPWEKEK